MKEEIYVNHMGRKGVSLPINSTAVLVLILMFMAVFFAIASGVIQDEVDKLIGISEKNTPDQVTPSSAPLKEGKDGDAVHSVSLDKGRKLNAASSYRSI